MSGEVALIEQMLLCLLVAPYMRRSTRFNKTKYTQCDGEQNPAKPLNTITKCRGGTRSFNC